MTLKKLFPLFGALVVGLIIGFGLKDIGGPGGDTSTDKAAERKVLYWKAPMDANFRSDKPGKSPMGMDLVPVYEGDARDDEGVVRISPTVVNNIGVRTDTVRRLDLGHEIETVGFVGYDDTKVSHVHMRADGWIEELLVETEGERVKKGDILFRIYSPTLVNAQSEFLQAIKSGRQSLIKASEERLRALGFLENQIRDLRSSGTATEFVDIHSEQDGIVVKLGVAENMYVTPGTTVLTIADLSTVWVLADVFEGQAQWMKEGLSAKVVTPFLPGQVREGVVDYVYPTIDPKTRTLKVRLKFQNEDEALKPNMYAEVSIIGQPSKNVLAIPRDALIRSGKSDRVVLDVGGGQFRSALVRAGVESGDYVEILSGLEVGQKIVVSGQFLIDSEASLSASFRRMGDAETDGSPDPEAAHSSMPKEATGTSDEAATGNVMGRGKVNAVLTDERKINITHEPIPAIGFPAMTMDFAIADSIDLSKISVGAEVHFTLIKDSDGMYVIKTVDIVSE